MTELSPQNDGSLRSRLSSRREELRAERPFDLDVPGYKGVLRARYRVLDYPTIRKIGLRQAENPNAAEKELYVAADTLVNACVCLLSVSESGEIDETRFKWNEQTARELFGIGEDELPDGSTARHSLMRMIPNSVALVSHYVEYDQRTRGVDEDVTKTLAGESEAGLEPA